MANLADCAVAIAKEDLGKLNGAIRKATPKDKSYVYITETTFEKDGKKAKIKTDYIDYAWERRKATLEKDGKVEEIESGKDLSEVINKLYDEGYKQTGYKALEDQFESNGWIVDWVKLNAYSYETTPSVGEYEDHITIYFGGRWDFPDTLIQTLDNAGVLWQGAGCEDGCDWQYDEFGNTDFGLRVGKEKSDYVDDDGTEYWQHYVEDTSE